jgi:hypothetical protein
MAKKELKPEVVEEPKEAVEEPKVPEAPKEKLLEFNAVEQFIDGNLMDAFKKYGYDVNWPQNEKRFIPQWLGQRCLNSGARLLTKGGEELSLE